eukprot:2175100-Karenia_brevis.AAC.1
MVTKYAKKDPTFENNPQQAILQTISDVTCQHLYTRPRSPSNEKKSGDGNPKDEMAVDEDNEKDKVKGEDVEEEE